jgi:hypothetical protein
MRIQRCSDYIKESLPQNKSVEQWEMVRKLSKGIDIGDRIQDMEKQGANIDYIRNPIDTGIETYQDYMTNNIVGYNSFDSKNPLNNQKKGPAISYVGPLIQNKFPNEK